MSDIAELPRRHILILSRRATAYEHMMPSAEPVLYLFLHFRTRWLNAHQYDDFSTIKGWRQADYHRRESPQYRASYVLSWRCLCDLSPRLSIQSHTLPILAR